MFLLDTDICIHILNGDHLPRGRLRQHATETGISAITYAELSFGVARSARVTENTRRLEEFRLGLDILPFDDAAAEHYGEIREALRRRGTLIGANDLLIAAHARSRGATLVTDNEREFGRVPDLRVENWLRTG